MKGKFISKDNPYELDYIELDDNKIIALTKKNANFIEAVVKNLDSNYKIDTDDNNKHGSKYWFKQMKEAQNTDDFKKALINCVRVIDNINSTHLEASLNGREKMVEVIYDKFKCKDKTSLLDAINVPLDSEIDENNTSTLENKKTLFYSMLITLKKCKKTEEGKNGKYEIALNNNNEPIYRNNISFASKFISYARKYLNNDSSFSKYDSVVSKQLPLYEFIYLDDVNKKPDKSKYENKAKSESDSDKKETESFNTYIKYKNTIKKILSSLEKDGIHLTEEEFDHIIWYTSKGSK